MILGFLMVGFGGFFIIKIANDDKGSLFANPTVDGLNLA
ncbi:hypothetical protein EV06_0003 [Prochlorococcus sp. MIT 0602]|nr:hypothetical protein EV07_1555 [Prochlorococcus sp. MIT 0603]KGG17881.1 hypothetical protein EV06_0003 [Prochlorococcus sp. MIT 0602]